MADRDEQLAPATRNYVIFGLLFVIAIGLAIHDCVASRHTRGQADSALRLLLVSSDEAGPAAAMADSDGFKVAQISPPEAIAAGYELLDDPSQGAWRAAVEYADEHGYGFVALDLDERPAIDWGFDAAPHESARFAVVSVGDVAAEGPRMHAVGFPDGVELDPRLADLNGVRLGLLEHPDFMRLWQIEPNASELQARRVFENRKLDQRREMIQGDLQAWQQLVEAWPSLDALPGSLAGPWEQVQAAPIPGGLLLELRAVRVRVDLYRRVSLEVDEAATLVFLPTQALQLEDAQQRLAARQVCAGLPERVSTAIAVAPDGSAVVIGGSSAEASEVFVFEQQANAPEPSCRARSLGRLQTGERALGRVSRYGAMAWVYDGEWLHWWDRSGEQRERIASADAYSGPWWVAEQVLALIGERRVAEQDGEIAVGYEPVLVMLATVEGPDHSRLRVEFAGHELFASEGPDLPALLDLRPVGDSELLLVTEHCPDASVDDQRRCLHRVHAAASLLPVAELLTVETLGPLPNHVELAAAADGSRVVWFDQHSGNIGVADLRGAQRMSPGRSIGSAERLRVSTSAPSIHRHPAARASLRISADGRIVVSESIVEFELRGRVIGDVPLARAVLLDLPATSSEAQPVTSTPLAE